MSDWLDVMLGELERRRLEDREAAEEARRRAAERRDRDTDGTAADCQER